MHRWTHSTDGHTALHKELYKYLTHSPHLDLFFSLMPLALSNSSCFFFALLRYKKKACSTLILTLQFDIAVWTFVLCLLPCMLLRHPVCKAGHLHTDYSLIPTIQGCILAAGGYICGSQPPFQNPSSCLSPLSHLLLLHMCSGEGKLACEDRCWKKSRPSSVQSLRIAEDIA